MDTLHELSLLERTVRLCFQMLLLPYQIWHWVTKPKLPLPHSLFPPKVQLFPFVEDRIQRAYEYSQQTSKLVFEKPAKINAEAPLCFHSW